MNGFDSITNINVEKMLIATSFMVIIFMVIFLKRRIKEYKHKVEQRK